MKHFGHIQKLNKNSRIVKFWSFFDTFLSNIVHISGNNISGDPFSTPIRNKKTMKSNIEKEIIVDAQEMSEEEEVDESGKLADDSSFNSYESEHNLDEGR